MKNIKKIKKETEKNPLLERFLKYIQIDSESNPDNPQCPSTKEQMEIAKIIAKDLKEIGFTDISVDKNAYVMAALEGNVKKAPTVGFIAHMDTVHTFSGKGIKPQIVENYDGKDIILNKKEKIVLSPKDFPNLKNYIGHTLITTDGTTVLGADDKAGVAEIIEAFKFIKENPEIKHGTIKMAFTPDEEIGRGADLFDVKKFACDFAYTIDGGELGELEYENFNAASVVINIAGRDIHPGRSKDKMINAMMIAMELHSMLPVAERPEYTDGYEGFFLLMRLDGKVENTQMKYIIRDHSMEKFEEKKKLMENAVKFMATKYKGAQIDLQLKDSYYNMEEKIRPVMEIVELAKKSMEEESITPLIKPIRGGTDGARLSYMGLPCPNIFTGGENFHGKYEFVSLESMEKAKNLIVKIVQNITDFKFTNKK